MPSYKELNEKYLSKVKLANNDKVSRGVFDALLNGKNEYIRLTTIGSSTFDPTWIDTIKDCLFDLGDIVNNPREVTKQDSNVTPIELAKKIDGESVQHLASHSHLVKEIDEKGNVVPRKILSHTNVEDIHTYENRFIATFIRRLMLFIEKRYEYIYNRVSLTRDDVLLIKNKSFVDGAEVEIETKITVKKDENDDLSNQAREYISRIELLREYVSYYYSSKFMKEMKTEKDVRHPIIQTNILRKNPKYRKCYETFLFIERFNTLGVSFNVSENFQSFNEEERKNINYLMYSSFLAVNDDEKHESIKKNEKNYKPRFLKSIDDEEYIYGEYTNNPLEFVRVDDSYRQYVEKKLKKNLPKYPNKYEKEFYHDEYQYRKDVKEYEHELEKLLTRKEKTLKDFEKLALKRIDERNKEEIEEQKRMLQAQLDFEESLIERKRREIIAAAKADDLISKSKRNAKTNEPLEEKKEEPIVLDEIKENKEPAIEQVNEEPVKKEEPVKEEVAPTDKTSKKEKAKPEPKVVKKVKEVKEKVKESKPVQKAKKVKEDIKEKVKESEAVKKANEAKKQIKEKVDELKEPIPAKKPAKKSAPKKVKPLPVEEEMPDILDKIPGKFIVKTLEGYYVTERKLSNRKRDAKIFDDYNEAKMIKNQRGGKVIKL